MNAKTLPGLFTTRPPRHPLPAQDLAQPEAASLLLAAQREDSLPSRFLAHVMAHALAHDTCLPHALGLPGAAFAAMLNGCFAGVAPIWEPARLQHTLHGCRPGLALPDGSHLVPQHRPGMAPCTRLKAGAGEQDELEALLLSHRAGLAAAEPYVAAAVAAAAMGANHLWEDLGLPQRDLLTATLRLCFPTLAAQNTADMRWKKFFYRKLCDKSQQRRCKAPNCELCSDYAICFPWSA